MERFWRKSLKNFEKEIRLELLEKAKRECGITDPQTSYEVHRYLSKWYVWKGQVGELSEEEKRIHEIAMCYDRARERVKEEARRIAESIEELVQGYKYKGIYKAYGHLNRWEYKLRRCKGWNPYAKNCEEIVIWPPDHDKYSGAKED